MPGSVSKCQPKLTPCPLQKVALQLGAGGARSDCTGPSYLRSGPRSSTAPPRVGEKTIRPSPPHLSVPQFRSPAAPQSRSSTQTLSIDIIICAWAHATPESRVEGHGHCRFTISVFWGLCASGISGLVVEYIVAIDVTRARFPADACGNMCL